MAAVFGPHFAGSTITSCAKDDAIILSAFTAFGETSESGTCGTKKIGGPVHSFQAASRATKMTGEFDTRERSGEGKENKEDAVVGLSFLVVRDCVPRDAMRACSDYFYKKRANPSK